MYHSYLPREALYFVVVSLRFRNFDNFWRTLPGFRFFSFSLTSYSGWYTNSTKSVKLSHEDVLRKLKIRSLNSDFFSPSILIQFTVQTTLDDFADTSARVDSIPISPLLFRLFCYFIIIDPKIVNIYFVSSLGEQTFSNSDSRRRTCGVLRSFEIVEFTREWKDQSWFIRIVTNSFRIS